MRVRLFELRLIAGALSILWAIAGGLVLVAYRPGGPIDLLVGLAACLPIPIALSGLIWPPVARGDRAFAGIVWLGLGAALLLLPSIGGVLNQILARGSQTLLPSLEAGYPWILALGATSLFAGLGIARRTLSSAALRRDRLLRALALAVTFTAGAGVIFASAAVSNDLGLRDRAATASRFGPTDQRRQPPTCAAAIDAGEGARVALTLEVLVDGRSTGSAQLVGSRWGDDFRWTAEVASERVLGSVGLARIGRTAWARVPSASWRRVAPEQAADGTLDRQVLATVLAPENRPAPEEVGLEFVEGARSRHCRIAIDGPTFARAFPAIEWLVGHPDLHRWRGELDYWVFTDGQLGQVRAVVNGEASTLDVPGLQADVRATMTATDRTGPIALDPPAASRTVEGADVARAGMQA